MEVPVEEEEPAQEEKKEEYQPKRCVLHSHKHVSSLELLPENSSH